MRRQPGVWQRRVTHGSRVAPGRQASRDHVASVPSDIRNHCAARRRRLCDATVVVQGAAAPLAAARTSTFALAFAAHVARTARDRRAGAGPTNGLWRRDEVTALAALWFSMLLSSNERSKQRVCTI